MRIALIARNDWEKNACFKVLATYPQLKIKSFSSLGEFKRDGENKTYTAFIMDIITVSNGSLGEKEFFALLKKKFPIICILRNPDNSLDYFEESLSSTVLSEPSLISFFEPELPRSIRVYPRKNIYLNVHLYLEEGGQSIKTNLWNISEKGCFVISTVKKARGEYVWLTINDLIDKTMIVGEIMWVIPWGSETNCLPGFGLSFITISQEQINEIKGMIIKA